MEVIDDLVRARLRHETVLTIGAFDGVHRGHQLLITAVVERARATNRLAALMTFHPHPVVALAPERAPRYLTTPAEKAALLERLGIDLLVLLPFNLEVASMPARDFMHRVVYHLRVRELWVGADFALGRNREGDVPRLRELGKELGYEVHITQSLVASDGTISSSRIRDLLREGLVGEAAELLGRYPSLSGRVVKGARRGRLLGFPTANLEVRPERAVPANGVYAVYAFLGRERHSGVANVGVRPSFDNGQRTVEIHLFDFEQEIYGCDLVVQFVARLRREQRFDQIADLIAQMQRDSAMARSILGRQPPEVNGIAKAAADLGASSAFCPYRYQEVEHTADRALWVWGEQMADLFVGAAHGMYSLMADLDGLVATVWRDVRLEGWDRESLLVNWLNELLYITEQEGLLFVDYRIEAITDTRVVARVGGVPSPTTSINIKAATFHELAVTNGGEGWSTVVTFDA